jgi:hypothetical protein
MRASFYSAQQWECLVLHSYSMRRTRACLTDAFTSNWPRTKSMTVITEVGVLFCRAEGDAFYYEDQHK